MADSPIRIAVELEGIEPNDRFQAACDELVAAAAELLEESSEVSGYLMGVGDMAVRTGAWTEIRPGVKGFDIGMPPTRGIVASGGGSDI